LLAVLGVITTGAAAQAPAAATASLPDTGGVVSAFMAVRGWVDAFDVPDPDAAGSKLPLDGAAGVCVILRRAGLVVGAGVDTTGDDLMVRRATGRALSEVLGNPAVANLPAELRDAIGRQLTVQVEVAGAPVPLLGTSFGEIGAQLEPGLDGVAIRRGDRLAMRFPAQMFVTNTGGRVERMIPSLAVEVDLPPTQLPELAERFDVSLYRFRTTSLVQAGPDTLPFAVTRGDTLVEDAAVTRVAIAETALGVAHRLADSMAPWDTPVGIYGTYRPAADTYEPVVAVPLDQALAAWALARYSRSPGLDAMIAGRFAGECDSILRQLEQIEPGEADPFEDPVACAAIVLAAMERPNYLDGEFQPLVFTKAVSRVRGVFSATGGFAPAANGTPVNSHGQALIAAAMARMLKTGRFDAGVVRQAMDAAWSSVPEHRQITLLPWIAWAEADYASGTGEPMARVATLRKMRDLLDASRIGAAMPGPPDLRGGFALTQADRLHATSLSLRPACSLAWMVRDARITPDDERIAALGRVLETARFVMQLTVRDDLLWAYRSPRRAGGGLRMALWDLDQPVGAQALGLVTLAETLDSIAAMDND
jgi:hypothetical protein